MPFSPDARSAGEARQFVLDVGGPAEEDVKLRLSTVVSEIVTNAIIHARTTYIKPDGSPGAGRYTDIWAHRNGHWLAISAHVKRC